MTRFIITQYEEYRSEYLVEATSEEEARKIYENNGEDIKKLDSWYVRDLTDEPYTIEEE